MLIARNWAYFRAWALFRVGLFTEFYGIILYLSSDTCVFIYYQSLLFLSTIVFTACRCAEGYNLSFYNAKIDVANINSQVNEEANAGL